MAISKLAHDKWMQAKKEAPRCVKNINERLGDPVIDESLDEMYAAVAVLDELNPLPDGKSWMPEDGLVEGRDFEYVTMLMNPATGSVDTEYHWRHEYRSLMAEGKDGVKMWGGTEFEDAGLIEVRKDENGDWVEVKA